MAQNNLRLIYQNILDISTTLVASSVAGTGTPITNLKNNTKSLVYRSSTGSTTATSVNLVMTFPSMLLGGLNSGIGVILAVSNLTSVATMRVRGFTGTSPTTGSGTAPVATTPGTLVFDSGIVLCNPYQNVGLSNWNNNGFDQVTATTSTYKNTKMYSRVWVPTVSAFTCTSLLIEIIDTNINKYFEASRLIVGSYWTPKYNTSYGLSAGTKDTSTTNRTEAGDLVIARGVLYNTLDFDLKWLVKEDRATFNKIVRSLGVQKPLFVSLFPDNSLDWEKEQLYQLYGNFSQLSIIDHSIFEMYGASIEIEEL